MYYFYLILILCFSKYGFSYQVKSAPLLKARPSWLKVCRRTDPELNNCLNDLFVTMFPELAKGIPEMNVDPFEPLLLDRVSVSKGIGAITLSGSLYDLIVSGPSNATATYTEFDILNKKWNFGLYIPQLNIKSQYNLKGKILVLPLAGQGGSDLKLSNVQTKVTTNISFPVVEGKEIVKIDSMKVAFTVGNMKVRFHNLFNGNQVLGQTVNNFINQHALEIMAELEESIGESLAKIFTDIMNNVYTKMPTELWLLTDNQFENYQKAELKKIQ